MSFYEIAAPLAARGIPQIRLKPRSKIAFDKDWPSLATTDLTTLARWDQETPDANCGCVAQSKPNGILIFETDSPFVLQRLKTETGFDAPETFMIRSSPGRTHLYLRQTANTAALGNVSQGFVKHGDFSVRVQNEYCVGAGSLHPTTGEPYTVVSTADIVSAPDWLVDWIKAQKLEKKTVLATADEDDVTPIPDGQRNSMLASIAGRLRRTGLNKDEIEIVLSRINQQRCIPPLPDSEIQTISGSISRYPAGKDTTPIIGGVPAGSTQLRAALVTPVEKEPVVLNLPEHPTFPRWCLSGTSIYEGLVEPFCSVNSRYAEYLFLPAMTILLNCLGTKVRIKHKALIPSIFLVLIGKRGEVIKSSSVESAIEYFEGIGLVGGSGSVNNAEGRSLVFEAGSPEGLGLEMARLKCNNAILYYDELSTLTNKAGIDGSNLSSKLLTMYESGKFQNVVKSKKDSYSFEPRSYCISLIACSTDKNFLPNWSKLAGKSSGLDDRFFFLMQPKELMPLTPQVYVDTKKGAMETFRKINDAIRQGVFEISNSAPLQDVIKRLGNRAEIRVEKFALGFAVDLGLQEVTLECLERGIALVEYEREVKKWLSTYEATTKEGSIQMELRNILSHNGGSMGLRELKKELQADKYGTSLWGQAYVGLIKAGLIGELGSGLKGEPKFVTLLEDMDRHED